MSKPETASQKLARLEANIEDLKNQAEALRLSIDLEKQQKKHNRRREFAANRLASILNEFTADDLLAAVIKGGLWSPRAKGGIVLESFCTTNNPQYTELEFKCKGLKK